MTTSLETRESSDSPFLEALNQREKRHNLTDTDAGATNADAG